MTRALSLWAVALVLTAAVAALSVPLSSAGLPIVPIALVAAYAALVEPPVEAATVAFLVGLGGDALLGTPLGLNAFACVVALVASRVAVSFVVAARGVPAALFAAGYTFVYALVAMTLLYLFGGRSSLGFGELFACTAGNFIAALVLFPLLHGVFVRAGLEAKGETLSQRLSSRGAK